MEYWKQNRKAWITCALQDGQKGCTITCVSCSGQVEFKLANILCFHFNVLINTSCCFQTQRLDNGLQQTQNYSIWTKPYRPWTVKSEYIFHLLVCIFQLLNSKVQVAINVTSHICDDLQTRLLSDLYLSDSSHCQSIRLLHYTFN